MTTPAVGRTIAEAEAAAVVAAVVVAETGSGAAGGGGVVAMAAPVGPALEGPVQAAQAPVALGQVARGTTISAASPSESSSILRPAPGSAPAWSAGQSLSWTGALTSVGWRSLLLPALLAAFALTLSLPRLTTPPVYVFDELYYAYTAGRYVAGQEAYSTLVPPRDDPAIEWTHPPLAKLLIAGGIFVAGDTPLGWRIVSVIFGALGVVIAYALALALTGRPATSFIAAGLLLLDGLYLVESRVVMSNLFLLVFTSGALLAFHRVLIVPPQRAGPPLLLTGVCLGLALATKWSAVALASLIGLVISRRMIRFWRGARESGPEAVNAREGLRTHLRWAPLALIGVPVAIYLASYLHFFLTGHDWADFVALHQAMLTYHRELGVVHDDSSPWWQWPLVARPVWYFVAERRSELMTVFGSGNPLLYWPMVVAVAWATIDWWGRRPAALFVLLIGFLGQWLPWALSPRGTFIYHFLPAVPLGCLALAIVLSDAWQAGGVRRGAAVAYALATMATFAFFFPVYTAMPLTPDQIDLRMWLPSWR